MLQRVGWGLADQALSSLTNFALGIIVARTVDVAAFGAFSYAFLAYAVGLGVNRSVASQPLVIRYSAVARARWAAGVGVAGGVTLWLGLLSALVAAAIAMLSSGVLREAFLALALVFPGLLYQDGWRYAFFAEGRAVSAFLNDLAWTLVMVPAMLASLMFWPDSVAGPVLAWGAAATVAALIGYVQARIRPKPASMRAWLREQRDLAPRYVGEFLTTMAASLLSLIALGAIAGLAAAGTLRAGGLLLGPLNILYQGVGLVAVPEGVALLHRSERALHRFAIGLAVILAVVALGWGMAMFLLPATIGALILGPNWAPAHEVVLPLAIGVAGSGVCAAALVALRALAAARHSFRANAVAAVILLGTGVLGAVVAAAPGAAWGYAVGNWTAVVAWWRETRLAFGERVASGQVGDPADAQLDTDAPTGWSM